MRVAHTEDDGADALVKAIEDLFARGLIVFAANDENPEDPRIVPTAKGLRVFAEEAAARGDEVERALGDVGCVTVRLGFES